MDHQCEHRAWEIPSHIFSSCKLAQRPRPWPPLTSWAPPLTSWGTGQSLAWSALGSLPAHLCETVSAEPLAQTDAFLQAGQCPGPSLPSDAEEAAVQPCSEHDAETKHWCYSCRMHKHYWAACTLLRAQRRRLGLPQAGEQYFDSSSEVAARVMTESKYISYRTLVTGKLGLELLHPIR